MKKLITILISLFLFSAINESMAQMKLTRFEGQLITGVDANSAFRVTISQGKNSSATLFFPDELKDKIVFTILPGGVVKVGLNGRIKTHKNYDQLRLNITCTRLEKINLSGASQAEILTNMTGNNIDINLSGASEMATKRNITVRGNMKIITSGVSELYIKSAWANTMLTSGSGGSEIEMGCNVSKSMDIECSGASDVLLTDGFVPNIDIDASGASCVNCRNVKSNYITFQASGASELNLGSDKKTKGTTSGASEVYR